MSALSIQVPFPVFQDRDGQPLDNGYVWIGTANLNPQTNPVVAYYDSALTIPAVQPLRTLNGFISRAGTPAQVYVDGVNYSILVQDSKGSTVYNFLDGSGISPNACGVTYDPPFTGAVSYPVCEKLAQTFSVMDFGATGDGITDDTAAIQTAINSAVALNVGSVYVPNGVYLIYGTLILQSGIVLYGDNPVGEYILGNPQARGATFLKNNDVAVLAAHPFVELSTSSCVQGIFFKSTNTTTALNLGAVTFGKFNALTTNVTNAILNNCAFTLTRSETVSSANTTKAIFLPARSIGYANYFHRITDIIINNVDIAINLQAQANANIFSNIVTRECHIHYQLTGATSECIENSFTSIGLFSISGTLSPDPIGFQLTSNSKNNIFTSYTTEMFGKTFDIDNTSNPNTFLGISNESTPSYANECLDLNFQPPSNVSNKVLMPFVTKTVGTRNTIGVGSSFVQQFEITGTLPEQNNNAGTLVAGDPDNKVIFRLPTNFTKNSKSSFFGKLKVFGYGPFGNGCGMIDVDFAYSVRDETTSAGSFSIFRVDTLGNEITGLYFLTGVASALPMGVALVGGNYGAFPFVYIRCFLEINVQAYGAFEDFFATFQTLSSTATADVTANDVTDSITMLTVGTTSV